MTSVGSIESRSNQTHIPANQTSPRSTAWRVNWRSDETKIEPSHFSRTSSWDKEFGWKYLHAPLAALQKPSSQTRLVFFHGPAGMPVSRLANAAAQRAAALLPEGENVKTVSINVFGLRNRDSASMTHLVETLSPLLDESPCMFTIPDVDIHAKKSKELMLQMQASLAATPRKHGCVIVGASEMMKWIPPNFAEGLSDDVEVRPLSHDEQVAYLVRCLSSDPYAVQQDWRQLVDEANLSGVEMQFTICGLENIAANALDLPRQRWHLINDPALERGELPDASSLGRCTAQDLLQAICAYPSSPSVSG